jgi:hypothetical protein
MSNRHSPPGLQPGWRLYPPDRIEPANVEIAVIGNFYIKMAAPGYNFLTDDRLKIGPQGQGSQLPADGTAYKQDIRVFRAEGQAGGSNWLLPDMYGINTRLRPQPSRPG